MSPHEVDPVADLSGSERSGNRRSTSLPFDACDTHFHVFDGRFPKVANAVVDPPDAGVSEYLGFAGRLGIRRGVIVQPSTYGIDNACLLDALERLGRDFRAIAVVDPSVTEEELLRLDHLGVRGIRFNTRRPGPVTLDMAPALAERISPMGWHLQLHAGGDEIAARADMLRALPVPIVFDHLAGLRLDREGDRRALVVVTELLERGAAYAKVSGFYHVTQTGPPGYADAAELARGFASAAPDRLLFGTDWPHPSPGSFGMPDDALMLDLAADVVGGASHKMFVDNPARLYGF